LTFVFEFLVILGPVGFMAYLYTRGEVGFGFPHVLPPGKDFDRLNNGFVQKRFTVNHMTTVDFLAMFYFCFSNIYC
jgi:hypothetical protein